LAAAELRDTQGESNDKEHAMADIGPPIALIAVGLILWLAVSATTAGISIQTIGLILFIIGVVWLVIELAINRPRRTVGTRERVVERPVAREREREVL
jgi:tetrahydromethanopterin S-methyltransferase subunit E